MGYGEVWWMLDSDAVASLGTAIAALQDAGLAVGNPATSVPQMLDDNGVQIPWDASDVVGKWAGGETATVQLWVNPETDVLVEIVGQQRLLTFELDGMSTAEARFTVFAVLNAGLSLPDTQAIIVDRDLADWGEELLAATSGVFSRSALPHTPDLLVTSDRNNHYSIDVRNGSWLSKPAAIVQSFT
jgi:hypothetical protein